MSKMDNLRALRESRHARDSAQSTTTTARRRAAPVAPAPTAVDAARSDEGHVDDGLCGHRAISGRTCTRERGHAAKSHRYA